MKEKKDGDPIYTLLFILLIILFIYVIGDVMSTAWLIYNDPVGLSNENNPLALLLYSKSGIGGLLVMKMSLFLPFSSLTIFTVNKYHAIKWVHQSSEMILLGFTLYSLIIVLNNLLAIIVISAVKGLMFLVQLLPMMNAFIILISLVVIGVLLSHRL
jgi:hypothetical protein